MSFRNRALILLQKFRSQFKDRVSAVEPTEELNRPVFGYLFMTTMPSVLVETGFITNPTEEKFLNSKLGQDYLASAIFRACRDYINEIDSKSGLIKLLCT